MMDELDYLQVFLERLECHARRKADLYDGSNRDLRPDEALRFLVEEVGEVASAITRSRWELAMEECWDVAHCAFLLRVALARKEGGR